MRELLIVLAVVIGMCLFSGLFFVPWQILFRGGMYVIVAGFAFGVPTGAVYHALLYKALKPRGELPNNWVWRPIRLNDRLRPEERRRVMSWCYAGAAGFVVICLGMLMMGGGVALALIKGV